MQFLHQTAREVRGWLYSKPPPSDTSEGPVLPACLPQQRQGLLLHPLLLTGAQPHHLLNLARVERVLPQVAVPEQLVLLRVEALQQQGQ